MFTLGQPLLLPPSQDISPSPQIAGAGVWQTCGQTVPSKKRINLRYYELSKDCQTCRVTCIQIGTSICTSSITRYFPVSTNSWHWGVANWWANRTCRHTVAPKRAAMVAAIVAPNLPCCTNCWSWDMADMWADWACRHAGIAMATSWKYETVKHKQILVSLSLQPAVEPASHHTSPAAHSTGTGVWQGGGQVDPSRYECGKWCCLKRTIISFILSK